MKHFKGFGSGFTKLRAKLGCLVAWFLNPSQMKQNMKLK
jgi:hypothetical protein